MQLPGRLGLHRQAQDARARTRSPSPSTRSRLVEDALGLPRDTVKIGIMDEERRTTLNLTECIRAGALAGGVHQHRLPRPHRRRDPHLDAGRADGAQGRHEGSSRGLPPTRIATSTSVWRAACAGRAQIGKGMWAAPERMQQMLDREDRPPPGGRLVRLGAVADRRHAARHALPRCGRRAAAARARRARPADGGRRPADHSGRPVPSVDLRRASTPRSRTTRRASWATSCAGSTRASVVPRCPTSTASS